MDWAISAGVGLWLKFALAPWGLLASVGGLASSAALKGYQYARGSSLADELALRTNTTANFRRLGRTAAGKLLRPSSFRQSLS